MDKVRQGTLQAMKHGPYMQATKYCFQLSAALGSPKCCVTFINFFHLSGGEKYGSLPQRSEEGSALRGVVKDPL